MKKVLKLIGIWLLAIIVIVGAVLLYISIDGIPTYEVEKIEYQAISTPEAIERGEKLTVMLCATCHMNAETRKLSGLKMVDAPPEFGEVYAPNITQDKKYGIASWSDAELLYLLRTGIKRDGLYSPPYMMKLPNMADEDINAIIAFLKSDHSMVTADATPDVPTKPSLLTKILCRVSFKPFPMPIQKIKLPSSEDKVALGKYLAHNLDCFSCHSADFKTVDYLDPTLSEGYFGGGNKPLDLNGNVVLSSNLTPDKETGIGTWTTDKFIKAVKYGIIDNEKALKYPMIPYSQLTDDEASAIFEYLKTIPEITNKVNVQ
ncbi:cytochrome c [Cellulophaga baltica]|uniref:c-type cytochrome n=1 Tax=Cellulophaga TaxID=104264 RepID=UPI001C0773DF|nr:MULTISPECIES: c-type cytochrome [Cellulophaga]MBU2996279.1 cytochrome c [Cellulophaga baltica]MDO6767674.1 c-type cytochrome [Cellulophaga sp. 1_MG-2023]